MLSTGYRTEEHKRHNFAEEEKKINSAARKLPRVFEKKRSDYEFQLHIGHRQQTHANTLTKESQPPEFGTEITPKRSRYEPAAHGSVSFAGSLTTRNDAPGKS